MTGPASLDRDTELRSAPEPSPGASAAAGRLSSIDAARAVVMILMTLDHASAAFNAGRLTADSAFFPSPRSIDALQFATRWITHVCAPAFVLLAGVGIALAASRRARSPAPATAFDRDLLIRGALLVLLDAAWMSWIWRLQLTPVILGVLSALGGAMILMVILRRLPPAALLAVALALICGAELAARAVGTDHPVLTVALAGGLGEHVMVLYPVLPWLGIMALGYVLGSRLAAGGFASARSWLVLAAAAALVFGVVRGLDGYGNFMLQRGGSSVIEWLRTSKYPPSLTYAASELALVFLLLAAFTRWRARPELLVLGRTALVFYLLHVHLLKAVAVAAGVHGECGLGVTALAWLGALVVLYPVCRAYDRVKQRHPRSLLRFL